MTKLRRASFLVRHVASRARRLDRRTSVALLAVAVLAVVGATLVGAGVFGSSSPPRPARAAQVAPLGPSPSPSSVSAPASTPRSSTPSRPSSPRPGPRTSLAAGNGTLALAGSAPAELRIPAIDVQSTLMQLGLNPDGTAEVPPLSDVGRAGWYRYSADPGTRGSAVILGHIDSATAGAGVFYRLGALLPGDEVDVTRADGSTAIFRIDRVAEYPKSAFPTSLIYGATPYASLKLVTCGGAFDAATHNYVDNIVAFASLIGQR